MPCCGASLNSNTVTRCQPRNKGKHTTFSIVLTAAPAQVPQTTTSTGDKGLTCRPTCRKKRNRASVSQDLCVSQNTAWEAEQLHRSIWGLCLQKPQSLHPKTLPHSHLSILGRLTAATRPMALFKGGEWLSRHLDKQRIEGRKLSLFLVITT